MMKGGENMSRNLLIFICIFLAIAFAITCADLYHKWQEERTFRILVQALAEDYEQDSEHYQQLYYDCLNQESYPWSGYTDK